MYIAILLLTLFYAGSLAAQKRITVSAVHFDSGANKIVIKGKGFGARGPDVHLFDTFEKGEPGAVVRTDPHSADVGSWDRVEGHVTYSGNTSVSGSIAVEADMSQGYRNLLESTLPNGGVREIFVSYWVYLPEEDNYPGQLSPHGINWKLLWIMGENTTDDDLVVPVKVGEHILIDGNDDCLSSVNNYRTASTVMRQWSFKKGRWHNLWTHIDASHLEEGSLLLQELTPFGVVTLDERDGVRIFCNSNSVFERVYLNGYGRQTPESKPLYDDVYIATGDHSRAGIVIGNNPRYDMCTDLARAVPQSWSDTSIVAQSFRIPQLSSNRAFIYVLDAQGAISESAEFSL